MKGSRKRIAYLMSWFPTVTETFILYELIELRRLGLDVAIFPLFGRRCAALHPGSEELVRKAHYVRLLSWETLCAQLHWMRARPVQYLRAWWRALAGNARSLAFLLRALAVVPLAAAIARRMESEGIEHVHAHWATHPALAALVVKILTGVPYSFTAHAHDLYVDRSMLAEKVEEAEFVVTISKFNLEFLAKQCGDGIRHKTFVIPCGVDLEDFRPRRQRARQGALILACVGSLREYKGHRYLIEACAELKERGLDFRCWLVGDGELREALQEQVARHGLEDCTLFLGAQPQHRVREILDSADICVLPSIVAADGQMEGIPVALMEAMAAGVPVVATRISGIPELVEDNRTGLLVPERDPALLATAILRLERDELLRARLASAGRAAVLARHDRRQNVAQLLQLLTGEPGLDSAPAPLRGASDGV